ncbi:hypothetical protein MED01_002327 [Micromonospora sp. MED01]|uniref:hypothetical protein n=1 Tax=Micromonospora alfalfae TaxID=2911212 RepID=UPI001EE97B9B|nr:hypothetical protein [Micromonospora alfalfae]MCG5464162.1 hypothetical protein [Micromonospora alfalfae]
MADRTRAFSAADRVATGVTLVACGAGALAQGWPLAGSVVGTGLGFLLAGVFQWRAESVLREQRDRLTRGGGR